MPNANHDSQAAEAAAAPVLTVQRIFAKAEKPRQEDLPEPYTVRDLAVDQIMVRSRVRLLDNARLVPVQGLVVSQEEQPPLPFYHADLTRHGAPSKETTVQNKPSKLVQYALQRNDRIYEERGVLVQSTEHYQQLMEHTGFFDLLPVSIKGVLDDPRFGEQLIVSGLNHTSICIGDVFVVQQDYRTVARNNHPLLLKLQVTSPRLPCAMVDKRSGSPYGSKGLKRYTMTHGLAGWFVRVLQAGDILEGMELVRVEQPHPKWTLEYISNTLYGQGDRKHMLTCRAQWTRSKAELEELCALEELGWMDWKAEAQRLLDEWEILDSVVRKSDWYGTWYFVSLFMIVVAVVGYRGIAL